MPHTQTQPELLLPAGSPEKLRYAVAYGADAVYLGLPMASLRTPSRGEQFTPENLETHVRYAQARSVKAYVTANIFAANHDLKRLIPHLEQLEAIKPDAVILSDPGVFRLARKHAPSVPVHLSTQANTLNAEACAFWQDLGVERVILAREVPLREIAEIHAQLPTLELECFVHGSLCVAYSGRCVISDYLTDNTKNSNKGMCGNSCRWEFEEKSAAQNETLPSITMQEKTRPDATYTFEEDQHGSYMLNSKDLCLIAHLRTLQDAGVVSFKVEGRTKSVFYVATAGRVYREAIDYFQHHETASEEQIARWVNDLSCAGNRGFTEGFFNGRPDGKAYNYQSGQTQQTAMFVATTDGQTHAEYGLLMTARNPVHTGDVLTWDVPGGTFIAPVEAIRDPQGLPIASAQTNQPFYIAPPEGVSHDALPWVILYRPQQLNGKALTHAV